jgi:hypothetical protein
MRFYSARIAGGVNSSADDLNRAAGARIAIQLDGEVSRTGFQKKRPGHDFKGTPLDAAGSH